jgi:hypothetical protein
MGGSLTKPSPFLGLCTSTEAKKHSGKRHQVLQVLSIAPAVKAETKNSLAELNFQLDSSVQVQNLLLLSKNGAQWLRQFWKLTPSWALTPPHYDLSQLGPKVRLEYLEARETMSIAK